MKSYKGWKNYQRSKNILRGRGIFLLQFPNILKSRKSKIVLARRKSKETQ